MRTSAILGVLSVTACDAFIDPAPLATPRASTRTSSSASKSSWSRPLVSGTATPAFSLRMSTSPLTRRALVATSVVGLASVGLLLAGGRSNPVEAVQGGGSGEPSFSGSGYDLSPLAPEDVDAKVDKLTELQKVVLTKAGTERPFQGKTVNGYSGETKAEGTWVSAVSGVPLFSSATKYDSGTGWPSFYAPIDKDHIIERPDPKDMGGLPKFLVRTEVLDRKSGTHLGHVFTDGPKPTGKRYCMNAASMAFIPKEEALPVKPSKGNP